MMELRQLKSCRECPAYESGKYVPPKIVEGARLVVLGERPGRQEMIKGEPFVGPAGGTLDKLMAAGGTHKGLVSLVNPVMCWRHGNPKPTIEEMKCCAPMVERALRMAKAEVVLACGGYAAWRMCGEPFPKGIKKWRGSVLKTMREVKLGRMRQLGPERYGPKAKKAGELKVKYVDVVIEQEPRRVVLTTHPMDLRYTGFVDWPLALADMKRAVRWANGEMLVEVGEQMLGLSSSARAAEQMCKRRKLALDVETDKAGRVTMLALADDVEHGKVFKPTEQVLRCVNDWLQDERNTVVGHNVLFDLGRMEQYTNGVSKAKLVDTMHAACFERPDLRRKKPGRGADWNEYAKLDAVASRMPRLKYHNWKKEFSEGRQKNQALYCMQDAEVAWYLGEEMERRLRATKRWEHFTGVLMPLLYVVKDMQDAGVRVDEEKLRDLERRQARVVTQLESQMRDAIPVENVNSNVQLMRYFYDELKLKPVMKRVKGEMRRTLDKTAVEVLAERYPECGPLRLKSALAHAREKVLTTYLRRWMEMVSDGRIHFEYNISGTWTGRLSGDGQQIPRPSDTCVRGVDGCVCGELRQLFLGEPGERVIVADYSQIEARYTAYFAQEEWLIEAFRNPEFDLHQTTTDLMSLYMEEQLTRYMGKTTNHLLNYGGGEEAVMKTFKCDRKYARKMIDAFKATRPKTVEWWGSIEMELRERGYLTNPLGRRAYLRPGKGGQYEMNSAISFKPQSTAGDRIYQSMVWLREVGIVPMLQAHDELVVSEARENDVQVVKELMEKEMPRLKGWECPVDVGVGANWGEGKENA